MLVKDGSHDREPGFPSRPRRVAMSERFARMFIAAEKLLTVRAARINRLNVFPVPDGDTGSNLAQTLRAAVDAGLEAPTTDPGEFAAVVARGALLGARGNSGVILSQYLRGFAEGMAGVQGVDGPGLVQALSGASRAAYAAVPQPVEGTILTAARKVAEATSASTGSLQSVLETATSAAQLAVSQTPEELPILREAGVVDAGAFGLATILEGMLHGARGDAIVEEAGADEGPIAAIHLAEDTYGYCTQFLLRGDGLDSTEVRERLTDLGDSLLVVGDETVLRVHLHTLTPGEAIDRILKLGSVEAVRIDDMQRQNRALRDVADDGDQHGRGTALATRQEDPEVARWGRRWSAWRQAMASPASFVVWAVVWCSRGVRVRTSAFRTYSRRSRRPGHRPHCYCLTIRIC